MIARIVKHDRCSLTVSLALITLLSSGILNASSKVGTSGAQFLKIGAGARPTAMGDSFVGVADDINAIYFNPAGLSLLDRPELTAMHTQYFEGFKYEFGAFAAPTTVGTFGFSAATLEA